jgi:hypothetical protein
MGNVLQKFSKPTFEVVCVRVAIFIPGGIALLFVIRWRRYNKAKHQREKEAGNTGAA